MKADCVYCGAPAERWCDFTIGFTDPDGDGLFSLDDSHEMLSCDAPLCLHHARREGDVFISGKRPSHETIDHCISHGSEDRFGPMTMDAATSWRRRHYARAYGGLRVVVSTILADGGAK